MKQSQSKQLQVRLFLLNSLRGICSEFPIGTFSFAKIENENYKYTPALDVHPCITCYSYHNHNLQDDTATLTYSKHSPFSTLHRYNI